MNLPEFTGSSSIEGPENYVEELLKVFQVMYLVDSDKVELAHYQLNGVARL